MLDREFARCAAIEGDLSRLECFDTLAKAKGLDGEQIKPTEIEGKGNWRVQVRTNPIDDSTTVTAVLLAKSGRSRFGEGIAVIARCKSNETDVFINWNDYLGREAIVLTRVGTDPASTARWLMSSDNKATFHPKPIVFLKDLLQATKLVAQVTPYNESPVTAVFDTSGLQAAIEPLRETCNW